MKIKRLWFKDDHLYIESDEGKTYSQSLLWYHHLREATDEERLDYTVSTLGIHWRNLNEDVSFESFEYDDAVFYIFAMLGLEKLLAKLHQRFQEAVKSSGTEDY